MKLSPFVFLRTVRKSIIVWYWVWTVGVWAAWSAVSLEAKVAIVVVAKVASSASAWIWAYKAAPDEFRRALKPVV